MTCIAPLVIVVLACVHVHRARAHDRSTYPSYGERSAVAYLRNFNHMIPSVQCTDEETQTLCPPPAFGRIVSCIKNGGENVFCGDLMADDYFEQLADAHSCGLDPEHVHCARLKCYFRAEELTECRAKRSAERAHKQALEWRRWDAGPLAERMRAMRQRCTEDIEIDAELESAVRELNERNSFWVQNALKRNSRTDDALPYVVFIYIVLFLACFLEMFYMVATCIAMFIRYIHDKYFIGVRKPNISQNANANTENKEQTAPPPPPPLEMNVAAAQSACVVCMDRKRDTAFLHGDTMHHSACYVCALRLQETKRPCPMCNASTWRLVRIHE